MYKPLYDRQQIEKEIEQQKMSVEIQKNLRRLFFSCFEPLAIDLKERIEVRNILDLI